VALFFAGDFGPAAAAFTRAGDATVSQFDPFALQIRDCFECSHPPPPLAMGRAALAAALAREQKAAAGTGEQAARAHLRLGTALYNVSHFGAWRDFCVNAGPDDVCQNPARNDPARAGEHFRAAAKLTADPELAAQATFGAAKCELVAFQSDLNHQGDFRAGPAFHALRERYARTRYAAEVLRECGYYRSFAGRAR
jgi:hypothetical protein